ncbi:MAG: sigma-70 family RNA polymerase sigma factor [Planctomycetota bacterium]|nr:sigma-70 family RNA polymerase sigma factor [Planctomycetota bacterium]
MASEEPTTTSPPPSPGQDGPAPSSNKETPKAEDLEEVEPIEEAPEPIEEGADPLDPAQARAARTPGGGDTSIRRPVTEEGHGNTSVVLRAVDEGLKPASSGNLKTVSESSGSLKTVPDASGKLKTLGEGKGRGGKSSGSLKSLGESKSGIKEGISSGTLKVLADPLQSSGSPDSASAVHRALEELPTVEELDVAKLTDEDLMRLCQEGDEAAFEVLFQRYEGPALSFIYRMIGDRNRTEALGQEAFLRIFKDAKSYQYPRSFSTWFYTIVRNLCKNELRWRSRHPTVSIEESVGGSRGRNDSDSVHIGDNLRSSTTDPLEQIVNSELTSKLDESLKTLPELERDILILKCFQGLKYREIAEVVGVPVGTVRSRIHAALERLRKSVKDYL